MEQNWHLSAACGAETVELFFPSHNPERPSAVAETSYIQARELCARCPVTEACLDDALRYEGLTGFRYGMWGGTTPWERRRIMLRRRRAHPPLTFTPERHTITV